MLSISSIENVKVAEMTDGGLITLARVIEDMQRRLGVVAALIQSEQLLRSDIQALSFMQWGASNEHAD